METNWMLATCALVAVLSSYYILRNKSSKPCTNKQEDKAIYDSLEARARANEGIKEKFGILNSFVSAEECVRHKFRKDMITTKNAFQLSTLDDVIPVVVSLFPGESSLKEIVQIATMGSVLQGLFGIPLPSLENMKIAANLIDALWPSEEVDERRKKELHSIISAEDLSKFIPAWESQWRLVYYSLLELFRHNSDERKRALENPEMWIKETLRLYPPVKRVIRKDSQGNEISFSIVENIRKKDLWGDDYLVFNPWREYTPEQNSNLKNVFGIGSLQCVAGLNFVIKFCGGIMKRIGERYDCVEEDKWKELISPLENRRDVSSYANLLVCKKD